MTMPMPMPMTMTMTMTMTTTMTVTMTMTGRWAEYLSRIPKDAATIYILTEAAGYA
jgi:hypothetical protein